jgi:hypothetical protein
MFKTFNNIYDNPKNSFSSTNNNLIGGVDELNNPKYDVLKWSRKHIFAI